MNLRDVISQARLEGTPGPGMVDFRFDAELPFFAGHFPGQPILPGIFQIEIARTAAEWSLGQLLVVRTVGKAKFTRPVRPGETLRLTLKLSADGPDHLAQGKFSVGDQSAGEVQLRLGTP